MDEDHIFEGDSSFANQSLQATQRARLAAFSTPAENGSAVDQSLQRLQTTLSAKPTLPKENFFFQKSYSQFIFAEQPLPAALVTCILKRMRGMRRHRYM
jgi:PhoPQ-activated pathogenicity-related protein